MLGASCGDLTRGFYGFHAFCSLPVGIRILGTSVQLEQAAAVFMIPDVWDFYLAGDAGGGFLYSGGHMTSLARWEVHQLGCRY